MHTSPAQQPVQVIGVHRAIVAPPGASPVVSRYGAGSRQAPRSNATATTFLLCADPVTPLPIDTLLPKVVQELRSAPAVVLEAPPGAGKTTRVPPALLD